MFMVWIVIVNLFNEIFYFIELVLQFFGDFIVHTTSSSYRRLCISDLLCIGGIRIRSTFLQSKIDCFFFAVYINSN
jgi:hypothetical protein